MLLGLGMACGIVAAHAWFALAFFGAGLLLIRPLGSKLWLAAAFLLGVAIAPVPPPVLGGRGPFLGQVRIATVPEVREGGYVAAADHDLGRFRLSWKGPEFALGDWVEVSGEVFPIGASDGYRSGFPIRVGRIRAEPDGVRPVAEGWPPFRWGASLRGRFLDLTDRTVDPRTAGIVRALTFNVDDGLEPEFRSWLQRSGTIHIISASGAHVLILAVAALFLLGMLPIPRSWQIAILLAILAIYAAAAGFRPPIVRAALMAAIVAPAYLARREADLLSALGVAMAGYLFWRPESVYDVGFQLSFVTVGGLAIGLDAGESHESGAGAWFRHRIRQMAGASLVASLAALPLVAYYFGQISLVSIPANLAIGIVVGPVLVAALLALAASYLAPAVAAGILSALVAPWTASMAAIVEWFGSQTWSAVEVPAFSAWWVVAAYLALLAAWRKRARPV